MNNKRLQKELSNILEHKIEGVTVIPKEDNLAEWVAHIDGPKNTPYFGGTFKLYFQFPDKYPFEPPKVRFITPIMHPNINLEGKICIDIFRNEWSASTTAQKILLSIVSLLSSPNPNDPLMPEIAMLYNNDYDKYVHMVEKYTKKHAIDQT